MAGALREHLVAYFEENHKLLEAGALQLLLSDRQPLALSRELLARAGEASPFVTREMVEEILARRHAPTARSEPLSPGLAASSSARRAAVPFELLCEGFTGPPVASQPIAAYEALFQSRFRALARMLRGRPDLPNLRPIRELRASEGLSSVIGMVREVRETPQCHHIILTVDDETGSLEMLVPKDSPGSRVTFLSDEVVGLTLAFSKEAGRIPRVTHVERPDVPSTRAMGRASAPRRAMFLSDLHIGSRSFLSESWAHLVEFLRGRGPQADLAASIDHVVIAGDLVDGIGIYPRQERDLAITDVLEQYSELGRRLAELPDRLTIVAIPGNHDAVSPAEPQPSLPLNLAALLPTNVHSLSNPSTFSLSGVVIEAYHGRSFDDLIPALPGASYARPTEVMKRMLQMRHLAPIYGDRTPLAPLPHDGLVIDPAPDILVTGHAHTYGVDRYRGVLLLNASTWQSETEYQRMRNISPVPARAAVVDLETLRLVTLDFSAGRPTLGGSEA
ncbi:MAG TPA: metallophosphoesterase [Thermoplasmata archaeon]|nr:metallophosphoesterase [Thermoplasmata archaeon]